MTFRRALVVLSLLAVVLPAACGERDDDDASSVRLVDLFDAKQVEGRVATKAAATPRAEWRFASAAGQTPVAAWDAGPGVTGLAVKDGALVGTAGDRHPILHVERKTSPDDLDQLQAIEVRMRVSAGTRMAFATRPTDTIVSPASTKPA
jgi:hypothetical protein